MERTIQLILGPEEAAATYAAVTSWAELLQAAGQPKDADLLRQVALGIQLEYVMPEDLGSGEL